MTWSECIDYMVADFADAVKHLVPRHREVYVKLFFFFLSFFSSFFQSSCANYGH